MQARCRRATLRRTDAKAWRFPLGPRSASTIGDRRSRVLHPAPRQHCIIAARGRSALDPGELPRRRSPSDSIPLRPPRKAVCALRPRKEGGLGHGCIFVDFRCHGDTLGPRLNEQFSNRDGQVAGRDRRHLENTSKTVNLWRICVERTNAVNPTAGPVVRRVPRKGHSRRVPERKVYRGQGPAGFPHGYW
jgi:hypothetical protein